MNFDNIVPLLSSSIITGIVVAVLNNIFNIKRQKQAYEYDLEKQANDHKLKIKLETNKFITEKKIHNIELLKDSLLKVFRYNGKTMDTYVKFFKENIDGYSVDSWIDVNNVIKQFDDNGYIFVEINNYFAYFPEIKEMFDDKYNFLDRMLNLNIYLPKEINRCNNFDRVVKYQEYTEKIKNYNKDVNDFIERVNEIHTQLITELQE